EAWDMGAILRFTIVMGLVSLLFDALTFAVLLKGFEAEAPLFQTGWVHRIHCHADSGHLPDPLATAAVASRPSTQDPDCDVTRGSRRRSLSGAWALEQRARVCSATRTVDGGARRHHAGVSVCGS